MEPIKRRDFLATAFTLTGAGALTLAGCGGGSGSFTSGGSSGGVGLVSRRYSLQLPMGFALPLTSLVMETGKTAAALDASGAFTTLAPNSPVPSLALLRDGSGRGVLPAFLPTDNSPITVRAAAVALLYYALGGFMLPEASRRPLVTLLEADAATALLAETITRRMLANPTVLDGDDAAVNAALKAASDSLGGAGRAVRNTPPAAALTPVTRAAGTRATRATVPPLLQVQPSGLLSNLEVVQGTDTSATTVTAVNHSRRFCQVYVYQTGTPDPLPRAVPRNGVIKLPSTNSLGVFSTINNLRSGQTAYVPVSTDPISLPLASGSTKTLYEIIVVGASQNDLPRGFYSDPKYADEQAKWIAAREDLSTQTWWQNLILPIFFEALGIAGLAVTTAAVEGSLAAIKAIGEASVVQLLRNASKGYFLQAVGSFWMVAAENTTAGSTLRAALLPLYEAAAGQLAAETAAARLALFGRLIIRGAVAAVVLIGTGDIGAVLADTTTAQPAEQWFATVFQPTLILDPTAKTIAPGQRVTFSVKPPANLNGTVSYAWTQTGATTTLSSLDGVVGNAITTASTQVDLVTTPSDSGTITVKVVATLTDAGGHTSELGTAQAVITLDSTVVFAALTKKIITTTRPGTDGYYHIFGGWTFSIPQVLPPNWTYAEALIPGGTAGGMSRADYEGGAPIFDPDGGVSNSPYGGSQCYNLGGGTVFIYRFGVGVAFDQIQKNVDDISAFLDKFGVTTVTFLTR